MLRRILKFLTTFRKPKRYLVSYQTGTWVQGFIPVWYANQVIVARSKREVRRIVRLAWPNAFDIFASEWEWED